MFVRDVTRALDDAGVPHCIVGGLAVNLPVPARELLERSVVRESAELAVRVVSLPDLVALKRAAGRAQDLADLRHLERLLPRGRS